MTSLSHELLHETDAIMQRWYEAWRRSNHLQPSMTEAALKDSLPLQLRVIGEQLRNLSEAEKPGSMWKLMERLHPEARVAQHIPIEEVVLEYKILVDAVREWIAARRIEVPFQEYSYFYQAVFELVAESVRRYTVHQAEQTSRERAEYLSGLTHQMRTPLSTLSLLTDLLEHAEHRPDAKVLATLQRCIKRLGLLVNGVMRLERFHAGEFPVRPRKVHPARLIDQVIGDSEHDAARKSLRLEVSVNRTLQMSIDPDLFLDALGNLVQNAIKYTSSGFVRVEVEEEPDEVLFRVVDSGPGIRPERQKELFRLLQPEKTGGVGIGLAIVQFAVAAQGGRVGVLSETGKGTLFWFRLPRVVHGLDVDQDHQEE